MHIKHLKKNMIFLNLVLKEEKVAILKSKVDVFIKYKMSNIFILIMMKESLCIVSTCVFMYRPQQHR